MNAETVQQISLKNVRPVSPNDHRRGQIEAPVKIIEFSDLECPYCKRFHAVLQRIVKEYPDQVVWIYRHLPLANHRKARQEAEASECAASLGGEEKFWAFVDRVFEITPSNDGLNPERLPQVAAEIDLDRSEFQRCLTERRFSDRVTADLIDARASGGTQTPYSILISPQSEKVPINGYIEYGDLKVAIENYLRAQP